MVKESEWLKNGKRLSAYLEMGTRHTSGYLLEQFRHYFLKLRWIYNIENFFYLP